MSFTPIKYKRLPPMKHTSVVSNDGLSWSQPVNHLYYFSNMQEHNKYYYYLAIVPFEENFQTLKTMW